MDVADTVSRWREWNPFRCAGTELPTNALLVAKLIVVALFFKDYLLQIPEPFLPLLPIEGVPRPALVRLGLQGTFLVAGFAILLNRHVRIAGLAAAAVLFLGPLLARGSYTNGTFFCGSVLLLISLHERRFGLAFVRAQIVIMYFGSALNKLLEPDWRSGQYMDYWLGTLRASELYLEPAAWLPPMTFGFLLGWGSIVTEFGLALGFAVSRLRRYAIPLALLFHSFSVFFSGQDFDVFFGALLASMLLFVPWPEPGHAVVTLRHGTWASRRLPLLARLLDPDGTVRWSTAPAPGSPRVALRLHGVRYTGVHAANRAVLLFPATYFALVPFVVWPYGGLEWIRGATLLTGLFWFSPTAIRLLRRRSTERSAQSVATG